MTLRLPKGDSIHAISIIESLLVKFIHPGVSGPARASVDSHLAWMRRQKGEMAVNARLETVPELQLTRITLEVAFQPIRPLDQQKH